MARNSLDLDKAPGDTRVVLGLMIAAVAVFLAIVIKSH